MSSARGSWCFRLTFYVVVQLSVLAFVGCRNLPTLTNSMCPPQAMPNAAMAYPSMAYNQNTQPYAVEQPQMYQQPSMSPASAQGMGRDLSVEDCITGDSSFSVNEMESRGPEYLERQNDSALQAILGMVDKLEAANEENAQLRRDLSDLSEEQERHMKLAVKATQFADKLRSDNSQLKSDLTMWEERLNQLESLVASRETHQQDALTDIDHQLDQLIAAYQAETSGRNSK